MSDVLKIDAATRTRLTATMELTIDPIGTTPEIKVDGVWYPATWQGAAEFRNGLWYQDAQTTGYFAGPQVVTPAGAVVLAIGPHPTKTRVSLGGDILSAESTTLSVLTSA